MQFVNTMLVYAILIMSLNICSKSLFIEALKFLKVLTNVTYLFSILYPKCNDNLSLFLFQNVQHYIRVPG